MVDADSITTSRQVERPESLAAPRARLVAVYPRELGATIELGGGAVAVGRDAIAHRTVSRQHCEVRWDARSRAHVVCDLASRNGAAVDGRVLGADPVALADGAVLRVGDAILVHERITADAGASRPSAALPGRARSMALLRAAVERAAGDRSPVLIHGETGSGKDYVARALHAASGRAGPLTAVNCAALSPQLIEAQLFGHVRGSFTGATDDQLGFFRAAHRGTLFLDEIGELPLELQAKLLRALQDRAVVPVGGSRPIEIDVRVVCATNRVLADEVSAGRFRRDLFARLALWDIRVPPLRERRVDLLDWIDRLAAARGLAIAGELHPTAAERLLLEPWPENLRGIERLVIALATGDREIIEPADLPAWLCGAEPAVAEPRPTRRQAPGAERMASLYSETGGNVRAMARILACERRQVYRWLVAYGLRS